MNTVEQIIQQTEVTKEKQSSLVKLGDEIYEAKSYIVPMKVKQSDHDYFVRVDMVHKGKL